MDKREEFSKWMEAIDSALSDMQDTEQNIVPDADCCCNAWDCTTCFPEQDNMCGQTPALVIGIEPASIEMSNMDSEFGEMPLDELSNDTLTSYMGKAADDMHSAHGSANLLKTIGGRNAEFGINKFNSIADKREAGIDRAQNRLSKFGMVDEEEMEFDQTEKPRSGKGVKLGSIIQKYVPLDKSGQESPLTYGDENLSEMDETDFEDDEFNSVSTNKPPLSQEVMDYAAMSEDDVEHLAKMAETILSMQSLGLSKDDQHYTEEELSNYTPRELKQCYDKVMGTVSEDESMMDMNATGTDGMSTVKYPPGTAPTMPEGCMTMEGIDKDVALWLRRFNAYDALKASKNPMMEKKKPDQDKDGVPDWADKKPGKDDKKVDEDTHHKDGKDSKWADRDEDIFKGTVAKTVDKVKRALKGDDGTKKEKEVKEDADPTPFKKQMKRDEEEGKELRQKNKYFNKLADEEKKKADKKDDVNEGADPEVLAWMERFSKLGNMKGYGR